MIGKSIENYNFFYFITCGVVHFFKLPMPFVVRILFLVYVQTKYEIYRTQKVIIIA